MENKRIAASDREENRIIIFTLCAFVVNGLCAQPLGSFLPFLREAYGLSYSVSGMLLSAHTAGNMIMTFLAGFLPIWLGRRGGVTATSVWMAIAYAMMAAGMRAPWILVLICFMTGISRGGTITFCNGQMTMLSEKKASVGLSLLHSVFSLGALTTPLLLLGAASLFGDKGWRIVAGLFSVITVLQVINFRIMPVPMDRPEKKKGKSGIYFLKDKFFWFSFVMLFFYAAAEYGLSGWLVTYFKDIGLFGAESSQLMGSLFWLAMFIGRMAGAYIVSHFKKIHILLVESAGSLFFILFVLRADSSLAAVIGVLLTALCAAGIYPTIFAFCAKTLAGSSLGPGLLTMAGCTGGFLSPFLIGSIAQNYGIHTGMILIPVLFALFIFSVIITRIFTGREGLER